MAYISVNGYDFPPPKRGAKPTVSTMVDAGRNANGTVVGQRVGRDQYKLDTLEWPWLTAAEWSRMLTVLSAFFVYVTFPDPVTMKKITIKMYPGDRTAEPYWIDSDGNPITYQSSLNTTYPNGYTAVTSRKIGGFHYGVVRKTNSSGIPISASGAALGSGWETNVTEGIVPNSVWTLLHRPTCDPTGMVYIGPFWGDIYLSSDNGASGLQSKKGVVPITGTEGLNWYIANERAMRVGKRLPTYAEFCKGAYGSPQGEDGNNTYAWSATSNTARTACGNVKNAVSATNVRDLVGNVWKWLDEFIHDPTGSAWNWYDVMSGQKVGQLYMTNNTGLHALIGGGYWYNGVHGGSRTVSCSYYPWNVNTSILHDTWMRQY